MHLNRCIKNSAAQVEEGNAVLRNAEIGSMSTEGILFSNDANNYIFLILFLGPIQSQFLTCRLLHPWTHLRAAAPTTLFIFIHRDVEATSLFIFPLEMAPFPLEIYNILL